MIYHILATRPNFTKAIPLINELSDQGIESHIIHTGQHYDYKMSERFFEELEIPEPKHFLDCGRGLSQLGGISKTIIELEKIFEIEKPKFVFVYDDVNASFAAALVCARMDIRFAHIEAGCRSWDRTMPEEQNRYLADLTADYNFCIAPDGENSLSRINRQGILVGNTGIDNIRQNKSKLYDPKIGDYILLTLHRPANVDNDENLISILENVEKLGMKTILPVHPRIHKKVSKIVEDYTPENITIVDPMGYIEFLSHVKHAECIITDSGGVQTEATVLKTRTLTVRESTEHIETLGKYGTNTLVKDPNLISWDLINMKKDPIEYNLWDGKASIRIVNFLKNNNIL